MAFSLLFVLPLVILGINSGLVSGLITVYKTDRAPNSPVLVKSIQEDESFWINKTLSPGLRPQHDMYGTLDKAFVQYHGSDICYAKLKMPPKSKVPWVLLSSFDTKICDNARRIKTAQTAGYAGLILYKSDLNGASTNQHELELTAFTIPIFLVSNEDGEYLRELFDEDHYEMRHFIRLEKSISWASWALEIVSPLLPLVKPFAFVCDVTVAFLFVIGELLLRWIHTAYVVIEKVGFLSFILLCLPFITLVFAAYMAEARIPHPFFGYHYEGNIDGESDHSDQEREDADDFRKIYNRIRLRKHFVTLGISPDSSFDKARAAYHNLSKRYHPDKSEGLSESEVARNTEKMKQVTAAWRELKTHFQPTSAM